jgi:CRP-like cAMP-binding protein
MDHIQPLPIQNRATFRIVPDRFRPDARSPDPKSFPKARKVEAAAPKAEVAGHLGASEPAKPGSVEPAGHGGRSAPRRAEPRLVVVPKGVESATIGPEPGVTHAKADAQPASRPLRSRVTGFLERSRIVLERSRMVAEVAADGISQAGTWSAATSSSLMQALSLWVEEKRRPRVDTLRELADAARYMVVTNRMSGIAVLSEEESAAVRNGTPHRRIHQTGSELAVEGDVSPKPMFIMSGWACRYRLCPNGRTQIVGLLLPGDAVGLRGASEPLSPTTISALTTMETVDATSLLKVAQHQQQFPGVLHALRRMYSQQEEFLMNQIMRLGTMSPEARLAHLLLELRWRLAESGLASETEFAMPIGNETLADTTALSVKQIAQAMKAFRVRNLVRRKYERVELLSAAGLNKLSGFRAPDTSSCGRLRMTPIPLVT